MFQKRPPHRETVVFQRLFWMTTSTSPPLDRGWLIRESRSSRIYLLLGTAVTVLVLCSDFDHKREDAEPQPSTSFYFFIASDVIHRLTYRFHPSSLQDTRTISTTPTNSLGFSHLNTNHILIVLVPHQTCNHSNNQATLLGPNVITTLWHFHMFHNINLVNHRIVSFVT